MDRREQKKQAAAHEADLMRKLRESQGIAETREDRQRSRNLQAAADAYDHANNKAPTPASHSQSPRARQACRECSCHRTSCDLVQTLCQALTAGNAECIADQLALCISACMNCTCIRSLPCAAC